MDFTSTISCSEVTSCMTAKRGSRAQAIRNNSEQGKDRLDGLVPVLEDWLTKVCMLGYKSMP